MQQATKTFVRDGRITGCPSLIQSRTASIPVATRQQRRHGQGRLLAFVPVAAKGGKSTAAKGFGAPKPQSKGIADDAPCPCGSGEVYEACCARYHRGGAANVPSPEALLRSRYSAYAVKDPQYIADTTHPDSEEYTGSRASYVGTVKQTMRRLEPLRLTILTTEPGASADEAFITFQLKRRIRDPDAPAGTAAEVGEVTERSRFVRVKGRWLYMDSEFPEEQEGGKEGAAAAAAAPAPEAKKPGFKLPFFQ